MYNGLKITICFFCLICFFSMPARAESVYQTQVKVIQAGKGQAQVDPGIQDVVREIGPVFQYTRFKVLKEKNMSLSKGQNGRLPFRATGPSSLRRKA